VSNTFDQFDVVNDPAQNQSADQYVPPNPFDQFDVSAETPLMEVARQTGEPFNRGLIGLLEFPVTLANAAVAGTYALAGGDSAPQMRRPLTEMAEAGGLIAPPEEQREGLIPRTFEFTGGSIVPGGAILNYGNKALASLAAVPSALQQLGRATASSPGVATAFDIASNFTAAGAGQTAKHFTDNEMIITMAELGGGFVPTFAAFVPSIVSKYTLTGKAKDWILESLAPFTESGGMVAASRRLQDVAADPKATATALDVDSPVPPFSQSGDPGLLRLQKIILSRNPTLQKEYTDELALAIERLTKEAAFEGGDVERAVHLLNVRQQMAVEEASAAVARLSPDATPRQISVAARKAVQSALDDAVKIEQAIWGRLDKQAPADIENAAEAMAKELSTRSADADPTDIPKWLLNKLESSPADAKLLAQLQKQGLIAEDGSIDPAIQSALERQGLFKTRQRTLDDVHVLRSRVLREIREEKGAVAPNRNKLRILGDVQVALLDDMTATGVQGIDDARAFSNAVNERFRRGRVGRLLGFDKTGAERVAAEDVLNDIVYGPASATTAKRFAEMANEAPEMTLDFIKAKYIESVSDGNKVNAAAHKAFMTTLKKKGMFEVFPELEGQLQAASRLSAAAKELEVPDSHINTTRINREQSRAALLLQANPGEEMALVLKSRNPSGAIQDLMKVRAPNGKILASDYSAVQGLKASFKDEVFKLSGGNTTDANGRIIPNGQKLKALLHEYRPVMRALHMNDAEISRLSRIAEQIRLAQMQPGDIDIGTTILDSGLAKPIDLLARWVGARAGGRLGQDTGSTLVMAGYMSKEGRERVLSLTASKAEKLLIQATGDPELYRALLLGPRSSDQAQKAAAKIIERAVLQLEVSGIRTLAVGSAQEEQK